MKQKELISAITRNIRREAYRARICEELKGLKFDENMMDYSAHTSNGKAFGQMEVLTLITDKPADSIYESAVEEAQKDIKESNYDIVKLLDMAGYNGEEYYKTVQKYAF